MSIVKLPTMSDDQDTAGDGAESSLACRRSRRGPSNKVKRRLEELARYKAGKKYEVEEELADAVYDVVDEDKYAERVRGRLEDNFIVDDDGEYADDGREIFEQDEDGDGEGSDRSGPRKKRKQEQKKEAKKRGNIKNLLLAMPGKRGAGAGAGEGAGLEGDEVLESLLGEIKTSKPVLKKPKGSAAQATRSSGRSAVSESGSRKVIGPARVGIARPAATPLSQQIEEESSLKMEVEDFPEEEAADDDFETKIEEEDTQQEIKEEMPEQKEEDAKPQVAEEESMMDSEALANLLENDDPWQDDQEELKKEAGVKLEEQSSSIKAPSVEHGKLPLTTDAEGNKVLRMYWIDAYEDAFKHPGTVWLFGKVYVEEARAFASCCVTVRNVSRQVFFAKRDNRYDAGQKREIEGDEVEAKDLEAEFNSKVASRFKIAEFRSRLVDKMYAFEHLEVPHRGEYLEVQYSPKYPALPSDLKGETFSRVFGAAQSSLEQLLLSRKMKGPGWIDIVDPTPTGAPISHCKVEAVCDAPAKKLKIVPAQEAKPPPPLTVMAFNMKVRIST